MDPAGLMAWYADDGLFRFANAEPARGKPAITAALEGFYALIDGMSHRMTGCWIEGSSGVWEAEVTFCTKLGRTVVLPAVSILRTGGGLVRDFRMVMDAGPILTGAATLEASTGR